MNRTNRGMGRWLETAAVVSVAATLCGSAFAQMDEITIYKGEALNQAPLKAASWGSGEVREASDNVYTGSNSIKLTTHGFYQGGRLVLTRPINFKAAEGEQGAYLQFIFMLPDKAGAGKMSGYGGMMSGMGGRMGAMMGGRGGRGGTGYPGGSGGSGGPGGSSAATDTAKPKPLANFRIVLITEDGKRTEMLVPLDSARVERETWKSFSIPMAAVPSLKNTSGMVNEIQIFGDAPAIVYLGEVRVLRDETPIRVDDLDDVTIAKNDTQTFTASAEAGPTALRYEWQINGVPARDNEKQEVTTAYQVVGEGKTFKHKFVKGGDYVVTLTVSDIYGLKKPVTKKMNVHVTL